MSEQWESDFDVYEGRMGDDRMTVVVDLAARAHAPLASHALRLQLRVAMRAPRPDGLRAEAESAALFALEDRVVPALRQALDARFVSRVLARGFTEFIFYMPSERRDSVKAAMNGIGDVAPYQLQFLTADDANWDVYGMLYPNPYALQLILNHRLLAQMTRHGDTLSAPRPVDHTVLFATADAARTAAEALAARGFTIDPVTASGDEWRLHFHRVEAPAPPRADEFVFEILDVILPLGGDYDGWGSVLVKSEAT